MATEDERITNNDERITSLEGSSNTGDIAALAESAQELAERVTALNGDTGETLLGIARYTRTSRRMIIAVIMSVVLDVALTVLLAFGFNTLDNANTQIQQITARLDQSQTVVRQKAFCPLYSIFLASESAAGRVKSGNPAAYDRDFAIIRQGYDALKCADFKGGSITLGH